MLKLLNSVIILVILCGDIHSINGEALQCKFGDVEAFGLTFYSCSVTALENPNDNKIITGYSGNHQPNKNDTDVKQIYISEKDTKYLPANLGSLFILTALVIRVSELKEIRSKDFQGMQNLEYLDLYNNKLTSVPSDVFSTLNKLNIIYLHSNQIKYFGSGAFDQLKNLNVLYLDGNICVNKNYKESTEINQMKHDIKENCLTSTERMFMQMENKMINEFNSLNEMVKSLLKASEGYQIEQQENINLRAELSAAKDLLMKANDQQKTSKDEQKTEHDKMIKINNEVTMERDQLKDEITDLKTINNKAKETIEDFFLEVFELKIERHYQREDLIALRSKLMEAKEQLAECKINERITC